MSTTIYMQLLEEGTRTFRPVPADHIKDTIYRVRGENLFKSVDGDEIWEFLPGSLVIVEEVMLSEGLTLVATKEVSEDTI